MDEKTQEIINKLREIKVMSETTKTTISKENVGANYLSDFDFSNLSVDEKHRKYIKWSRKFKPQFKDADIVELDDSLEEGVQRGARYVLCRLFQTCGSA